MTLQQLIQLTPQVNEYSRSEEKMTKENFEFDEWMDFLRDHAAKKGGKANFPDEWQEDYDAGLTPEEAWSQAWD